MRAQAFIPRYSFGVYPVTFLNIRLRWCGLAEFHLKIPPFLHDLAFYSRQSVRHLKENIHVPSSILIEFSVNG